MNLVLYLYSSYRFCLHPNIQASIFPVLAYYFTFVQPVMHFMLVDDIDHFLNYRISHPHSSTLAIFDIVKISLRTLNLALFTQCFKRVLQRLLNYSRSLYISQNLR